MAPTVWSWPGLSGRSASLLLSLVLFPGVGLITSARPLPAQPPRSPIVQPSPPGQAASARALVLQKQLAARDLVALERWQQQRQIPDPHKYLLPVILARLSLPQQYDRAPLWQTWLSLNQNRPSLYHFRSIFDVRLFFLFRDGMPPEVKAAYKAMGEPPRVYQWNDSGTENHMFMQRVSGLTFLEGNGWPNARPAIAATNEAWLRAELTKFYTIGQGEFHSSTYYGYSIASLLNLYDFGATPELRRLAKAGLDWYAANMALRMSWGTAGGAESRGYDRLTWGSGLGAIAWVWWGDGVDAVARMKPNEAALAMVAATSSYRPDHFLATLARKQVPLPFLARMSHPVYYSYQQSNQFWETLYVTQDYSLGTLLLPQRSYQVKGTINAQYATYKLVVRDPKGVNNAVISLGGTFHTPMATGHSPGDQTVQGRSSVIYQLVRHPEDRAANVPGRSHLVLPARYGRPQRHGSWYIWRVEGAWVCARAWGDRIEWMASVSDRQKDYQALAALGDRTAWITDVARVADYPDWQKLTAALDRTQIDDRRWESQGQLSYTGLEGDRISLTYGPNAGIGQAEINGKPRILKNWPVIDSPYLKLELGSGLLEGKDGRSNRWQQRMTLNGPS